MEIKKEILELIFPRGIFEWFEITQGEINGENVSITLEEKDLPPIQVGMEQKIVARKFHDITVTDFPLRGKRTLLTFRRRYWQIDGQKEYLKRDLQLTFPGTKLEHEFAVFLKEDGGRQSGLASFYRQVSSPPGERI